MFGRWTSMICWLHINKCSIIITNLKRKNWNVTTTIKFDVELTAPIKLFDGIFIIFLFCFVRVCYEIKIDFDVTMMNWRPFKSLEIKRSKRKKNKMCEKKTTNVYPKKRPELLLVEIILNEWNSWANDRTFDLKAIIHFRFKSRSSHSLYIYIYGWVSKTQSFFHSYRNFVGCDQRKLRSAPGLHATNIDESIVDWWR